MEEERRAKHRLIDVQRRHTETALLEQLEKLANLAPDEPVSSVAAAAEAQKGGREDSLSVPAAAAAGGTGKRTRRKRGRLTLLRSSVAKMAQLKETIASLTATCSAQAQMLEQQSAAVTALRGGRQQQQALMQQEQQRREEYRVSHQSLSSCFLRGAYGLLLIDVASGSVIDCNSLYCQWTSWPRQALLNHLLVTPHEVLLHYDEDNIARFQQMRDRHLLRYRDSRPLVQQPPPLGQLDALSPRQAVRQLPARAAGAGDGPRLQRQGALALPLGRRLRVPDDHEHLRGRSRAGARARRQDLAAPDSDHVHHGTRRLRQGGRPLAQHRRRTAERRRHRSSASSAGIVCTITSVVCSIAQDTEDSREMDR